MSAIPSVTAAVRTHVGTIGSRHLRIAGKVPGNIYGLGAQNVSVSFAEEIISPLVASGALVLNVDVSGDHCTTIVREAQWDTYFTKLLHVDLQRVNPDARVTIVVPIEVKGTVATGVLDQPIHSITLNCLAYRVPDAVVVRVTTLVIGNAISVGQLELPDGAICDLPADTIVVRVRDAAAVTIAHDDSGAHEPELIGRISAKSDAE